MLFVGAGDIAECSFLGHARVVRDPHELTADLIRVYPPDTPVFTLGDTVYADGTTLELESCYARSWGEFRDRTWPAIGNHDYTTARGKPYFAYFGERAGDPERGYYSFELGAWHVIVLNSNCSRVACDHQSAQLDWLRQDLAAHPSHCTLAYWHHPRWASDRVGDNAQMAPFVETLYTAGVDLALVGHSHNYERIARLAPDGTPDPERGLRQLVVGTGGGEIRGGVVMNPHSERFIVAHGIVELSLYPDRYGFRFIQVDGTVGDEGGAECHDPVVVQ